jgi:hypothetical protein
MMPTPIRLDVTDASNDAHTAQGGEHAGFQIGWDHARHGLVPPPALRLPGHPVGQGWQTAQAVFGRRPWPARTAVRQWLALRLAAWQADEAFEADTLTPQHLAQIAASRCAVRRVPLNGVAGSPDAAVVLRLNPQAAWAPGHLVVLSATAADAMAGVDAEQARRHARLCEREGGPMAGLDAAGWWRVATLRACASALPFSTIAQLPLAVLPPNRVRMLNAVQGLQALVTQAFAGPGWAARCAAIAALLPAHTLRHDFNLFVGAMAPRVLAAPTAGPGLRDALEDAWLQERVQRRWQHFALCLGETGVEALLDRVVAMPRPGRHVLQLSPAQAVEAWQLPAAKALTGQQRVASRGARGRGTTTMRPTLTCPRAAALPT